MTLRPFMLCLASAALCGTAQAQNARDWSQSVVREAEQALAQSKYSHGPVDGRMDADTRYGLRQFQRSHDLEPTGNLNMETLSALGIEQSEYGARARGPEGERAGQDAQDYSRSVVRRVEQILAHKQFVTGAIDGNLDSWSRFGLDSFQRFMDLTPTGELNAQTLAALGIEGPSASTGATGGSSAPPTLYTPQNIRAVEQALKARNYEVGPVNNVIELDTQYGLQQFQRDQGLAPTGNFNFETLEALGVNFGG